jgi:mannose-6-phosphate isomerase-like protein (cupin superfamily)
MISMPSISPVIVPASGHVVHHAFGDELIVLLDGERTGGKYMCGVLVTPPGGGPPPHCHELDDEWFYVIEGKVEFFVNGTWTEAGPGQCAFLPKGVPHTFRNIGDTPLRMLLHTAPAGFETFFARMAELFHAEGGPDMDEVVRISAEHGITYPPPKAQ